MSDPSSVPPTQPPAAPETDVRLTEAEREALDAAVMSDLPSTSTARVVERIVAERVRVVEGERDAWESTAYYWSERAESAEAAHRALQAAVEALADEWEAATCITDGAPCTVHRHADGYAADLRALLAGARRVRREPCPSCGEPIIHANRSRHYSRCRGAK